MTLAAACALILCLTGCKKFWQHESNASTEQQTQSNSPQEEVKSETLIYSVSADGTLNIRRDPSARSPIVGVLTTGGEGARLLETLGDWYKVQYGDVVGYVNARYASTQPGADRVGAPADTRTVYYVVIGSYSSLAAAKSARNNIAADWIDCSPIFMGYANGQPVYRICAGIYYSKANAKEYMEHLNSFYGYNAWIWPNQGNAQCVDRPNGYDDKPVAITPS